MPLQALKAGGRLLIRDHGIYDITQLRCTYLSAVQHVFAQVHHCPFAGLCALMITVHQRCNRQVSTLATDVQDSAQTHKSSDKICPVQLCICKTRNRALSCRLRPEQKISENMYKRGDSTLCYFFSTEDLIAKAAAAGFTTEECSYVCVQLLNRKKNFLMRRVFVHGIFRKPEQ